MFQIILFVVYGLRTFKSLRHLTFASSCFV